MAESTLIRPIENSLDGIVFKLQVNSKAINKTVYLAVGMPRCKVRSFRNVGR